MNSGAGATASSSTVGDGLDALPKSDLGKTLSDQGAV
jgi:hypothetical protein